MTRYVLLSLMFQYTVLVHAMPASDSLPGPVALSGKLLYAVRTQQPSQEMEKALRDINPALLKQALSDASAALAFWLNVYNAFTQLALQKNPDSYLKRSRFYRTKRLMIAGRKLSLDDIEHGILRHSAIKWGLGYLKNPFPGKFEKEFRIIHPDPRIHFALNCGAKSCPPIAYYQPDRLQQQLKIATLNYLRQEVQFDSLHQKLILPSVFNWFRGDFGGKKKIYRLLQSYHLLPAGSRPAIRYSRYNWALQLSPETVQE